MWEARILSGMHESARFAGKTQLAVPMTLRYLDSMVRNLKRSGKAFFPQRYWACGRRVMTRPGRLLLAVMLLWVSLGVSLTMVAPGWARDAADPLQATSPLQAAGPLQTAGIWPLPRTPALDSESHFTPAFDPFPRRLMRLLGQPHGSIAALRLSDEDSQRYRRIFQLQDAGNFTAADAEIAALADRRLMGPVEQQRLLHPDAGKISYDDLRQWLERYGDHAGADQIHALALRRLPSGERPPEAPEGSDRISGALDQLMASPRNGVTPRGRAGSDRAMVQQAVERIEELVRTGRPSKAIAILENDKLARQIEFVEYDALRSRIAASFFYENRPRSALSLAAASAARSGASLPSAYWIAGLAAWRLGHSDRAAHYFEAVATHPRASIWEATAGAYWAARAFRRHNQDDEARLWFKVAAQYPRNFYGLLARRELRASVSFRWDLPQLSPRHLLSIGRFTAGRRAIALLQAGQNDLAEAELARVRPQDDALLQEALVVLADAAGLAGLAIRLGSAVPTPEGETYDAALYPVPHWAPEGGFAVDRALLYAFMRQESRFDPKARSQAGAQGLMQLRPISVTQVADGEGDNSDSVPGRSRIFNPSRNLDLGQRYLRFLLDHPEIGNNLFYLAAAYNAGPSAVGRWRRTIGAEKDPLLFIESLSFRETREFVQRVMVNFWIYSMRLGQDTESLDTVIAGRWPMYRVAPVKVLQVTEQRNSDGGESSHSPALDAGNLVPE